MVRQNHDAPGCSALDASHGNGGAIASRRSLLQGAAGLAAGVALMMSGGSASAQASSGDVALLQFALQLKYLSGNLYSYALYNQSVEALLLAAPGDTPAGPVTGARLVNVGGNSNFLPLAEIYNEHQEHIRLLRDLLFQNIISQPAIDLGGGGSGPLTRLARLGGLVASGAVFDPYASLDNLLLSLILIENVVGAALQGMVSRLSNVLYVERMAALSGIGAYHSGIVRNLFYQRNRLVPDQLRRSELMAAALNQFDGPSGGNRGMTPTIIDGVPVTNIVTADMQGRSIARSPERTLNILFIDRTAVTQGGFFPSGVKGSIRTSAI